MMKKIKTTKQSIMAYLEGCDYVSGTELESNTTNWQTKASNIDRRCRELVNDGLLEVKLVKGCVWYKKIGAVYFDESGDMPTPAQLDKIEIPESQGVLFQSTPAPPRFTMDPLTKKVK